MKICDIFKYSLLTVPLVLIVEGNYQFLNAQTSWQANVEGKVANSGLASQLGQEITPISQSGDKFSSQDNLPPAKELDSQPPLEECNTVPEFRTSVSKNSSISFWV